MNLDNFRLLARTGYAKALVVLGTLGTIATIYSAIHVSGPQLKPSFFGRWSSTYEYPVPGGTFSFSGVTEFIRNGHYNLNGTFKFSVVTGGSKFAVVMPVHGVGEWNADDEYLTFTLKGLKIESGIYKLDALELPMPTVEQMTGIRLPDLNQHYLPGGAGEVKIISQTGKEMILEGVDPGGAPFRYVTVRQDSLSKT